MPRTSSLVVVPLAVLAGLAALGVGCSGTTVPWTFEDEPVCADFKVGASTEMSRGGLKKPIRATFKKGNDVLARVVIYGLRDKTDAATPLLLPDSDAEYDVEWAECENERAPVIVTKKKPFDTKYECGEAKPYANLKVATKSGQNPRKLAVTLPTVPSTSPLSTRRVRPCAATRSICAGVSFGKV